MKSATEIIDFLKRILTENDPAKTKDIALFQKEIFHDNDTEDETLNNILADLALDLDFYEPNEGWRKQSSSFYSDQGLQEVLKDGIKRLEDYINRQ